MVYKVRIIIYNVGEDEYLNSLIINNKFDKTIEVIRTYGFHYCTVYPVQFIKDSGFC